MPNVTMPNGDVVAFPDDMPREKIKSMIATKFPELGQAAKSDETPKPEIDNAESKAVRFTQGALDPVFGIAQLVPRGIGAVAKGINAIIPNDYINGRMSDELAAKQDAIVQGREKWYQQAREADGQKGFDGWRMAGNVLSPANLIPGKIAGNLGKTATAGQRIGKGAIAGGIFGATAPVTDGEGGYAEQKLKQMGIGAALGGGIPMLGEVAAKTINPALQKGKQLLIDSGVRLTPGQMMGGWAKTAEDKLQSVPILGDAITAARQRGLEDSNIAVANRALAPIGKSVPKTVKAGRDLVNHVDDTLSNEYEAIIPQLTGKIDDEFTAAMKQLDDMVNELPDSMQKQFRAIVENNVGKKVSPAGFFTGESIKRAESAIGKKSRAYTKSLDPDQQDLGNALRQVQANIREWLARQNPQHAEKLRKINEGWANYERMKGAAGMLGAPEGVFSPAQLANNVKKMGGRNQYAKGEALMQDMSEAAKSVLPTKYPDSGTAGRYLLGAGALGGGYFSPAALGGLLGGAAMYSRPSQALLQYLMAAPKLGKASAPVADGIRRLTNTSGYARAFLGGSSSP